tara:strand:+ start:981 stop:1451 length:471 start_codon:yes stop_codon:yes gene_type:complete
MSASESDKPLSFVENRNLREHPTETNAPAFRPDPLSVNRSETLEAMNHHAKEQIDRLQEQAQLLLRQAQEIEARVQLAEQIAKAEYRFTPVLLKPYHLYKAAQSNSHVLSLVGPEEWSNSCPYGSYLACVRQLGDGTWEPLERGGSFETLQTLPTP